MVNTRADNVNKRLGLPDKPRGKRPPGEIAKEKRLKEAKVEASKADKKAKQALVREAEKALKAKQAQDKKNAANGPTSTLTKVKKANISPFPPASQGPQIQVELDTVSLDSI